MCSKNPSLLKTKIQVLSFLHTVVCCAGRLYQAFLSASIWLFLVCPLYRGCSASFQVFFPRENCSICSYRFSVFVRSEFRILLYHHLEPEPRLNLLLLCFSFFFFLPLHIQLLKHHLYKEIRWIFLCRSCSFLQEMSLIIKGLRNMCLLVYLFLVDSLRFYTQTIMSSKNRDFNFFLSNLYVFFSVLARTCSIILYQNGTILALFHIFGGRHSIFPPYI